MTTLRLGPEHAEIATVEVEFDLAGLLTEIVRETINLDHGPDVLAQAILAGIVDLFSEEQVEILDQITGPLELSRMEMDETGEEDE